MSNEHEQSYGDTSVDWRQQEESEQQRWEDDAAKLLDNDPGYHAWANARDVDDAEYVAHINRQAEVELERNGGGLTIEAWDR